jgi:acyl-CoA synthetase (AMP-forming)/AMP-acid ligase II
MSKIEYPHIDKPWMKYYDDERIKSEDAKTNLADYIKQKNKDNTNGIAETYFGTKTTYQELFDKIDNFSKMLVGLGIKKGDRIMYLVPNIPESGQLWLASSQIGAISDFVDPRPDSMDLEANAKKILEIIKHEKANYIISLDKCYLAMLKPIENELKELGINEIVTISASDSMNMIGKIDYLRDVIKYNELRNIRISDSTIKKLRWYEAMLKKIQSMKQESLLYEEAVKSSPLKIIRSNDLLKNCSSIKFTPIYDENLLSYIGHTSGTSGARPKPITLTNRNQISGTEQLFKANANFQVGDKILHELPFFSPLGADNNYILNLASGSNNIDIPEFEINEFGYLVKKHNPNVILGTPSWLASLPDCRYLDKEDLSCITRIIYGGDSMTRSDEEKLNLWLKRHGSKAEVEKGHGMSEYCGCGSYAQGEYNRYESIGIPLPDTIYTIVDPNVDDKLIPLKFEDNMDLLIGELAVSSPAVTNGTLDDEVVVPHYEMDGRSYIRTRDLVKMNRDGIFMFDSRKDRSFTRFDGYKVKPYEIEKVIEENPKIKYCRIVQYYDDKQRGLMPIAHIVPNEIEIDTDEQIKLVEEIVYKQIIGNPNMSSRQIPSKFKMRDSLPLSKNSKVSFNELINEGIDGTEINVDVEETNLSVGDIKVYSSTSSKVKTLTLNKK